MQGRFLTIWARKDFFGSARTKSGISRNSDPAKSVEKMDKQSLEYEILQCVDKGLSVYGSSIRQTVYWQLLTKYKIKASDIPSNPGIFSSGLESILGSGGAVMVERAIVNEMIARFSIPSLPQKKFSAALDTILQSEVAGIVS